MKRTIVALLAAMTVACASSGGFKIPDVTIVLPPIEPTKPVEEPARVPQATISFVITDSATGEPIPGAQATFVADGSKADPANGDGFTSAVRNAGGTVHEVRFEAQDYQPSTQAFKLGADPKEADGAGNQNFNVKLTANAKPVEDKPFQNLNIVVRDSADKTPIVGVVVLATHDGFNENRTTDGGGFVNFGVRGASTVTVSATDYAPQMLMDVQPGDREILLVSTKPKPPKPAAPVACGTQLNTGFVSFECLNAVAKDSEHWPLCAKGSADDCSLYTWEVARALNVAQNTDRWGLITKPSGSNFRGFGEDVVAFLPSRFSIDEKTWQWNGVDIIGGLGGPAPTRNPGKLHGAIACGTPEAEAERWCNRSDNFWAPVPKQ